MNYLPKTLSKEVSAYVNSWKKDENNMKSNPRLFMRFVQQASQDYNYVSRDPKTMTISYCVLSTFAITDILPINDVIKTVLFMSRNNKRVIINEGDVCFKFDNVAFKCISLFMLPHCSVLRERWLKKAEIKILSVLEFLPASCSPEQARFLVTHCLPDLYLSFFEYPLQSFQRFDHASLFMLIQFCRGIGYKLGFEELQRVYCKRINNYKVALEELIKANKNKLNIIEEFCRRYLEQLDIYHFNKNGTKFYVALTFINNNYEYGVDFRSIIRGYLDYPYPVQNSDITVFITHLFCMNEQTTMVNLEQTKIEQFAKERKFVVLSDTKKLKELEIEHIVLTDKGFLASDVCIGLSLFFSKVQTISFSNWKQFSEEMVTELAEVKPSLDCLVFSHMEVPLQRKNIELIGRKFPSITKIGFCFTVVTKDVVTAILKTKTVVKIEFSNSKFELPDDDSLLSKLVQIELTYITQVGRDQILKLLTAAKNVRLLSFINVKDCSLQDYPYPQNIVELSGFFEAFYAERDHLKKFINLRFLKLLSMNMQAVRLAGFLPRGASITMGNLNFTK